MKILSTKKLSIEESQILTDKNYVLIDADFIDIEFVTPHNFDFSDIKNIIFTSQNAVRGFEKLNPPHQNFSLFTINGATAKMASKWGTLCATSHDAASLADLILKEKTTDLTFFCGNLRRPDLPEKLRNERNNANKEPINLTEIIVYQTVMTPIHFSENFDAVLFFSPSAVESFFSHNTLSPFTRLFCIGKTTASQAKIHAPNHSIFIAPTPSVLSVLKMLF